MEKYNVSEIIDFKIIEIFQIYSYFVFILSLLSQCFYTFLVIHCSTKQMLIFRILMLIYIFITFLAELLFFLLKPIKLFTFNIIFPVGLIAPVSSSFTCGLGTGIILFLYYPLLDVLLITVAERHFQIISVISTNNKKLHRIIIYGGLLITALLSLGAIIYFVSKSTDDSKAKEILTQNIKNVEILLNMQPSLFIVQVSKEIEFLIPLAILLGSGVYRTLLCLWLLHKNLTYSKNTLLSFSKQTKKQFSMMLQTAMAQATITISVGSLGIIWMVLIIIPDINLSIWSMAIAGVLLLYPIIDVSVTIFVVKPYREFVMDIFINKLLNNKIGIAICGSNQQQNERNTHNIQPFQKRFTTIASKSSVTTHW